MSQVATLVGKEVRTLVLFMASMASHPMPLNAVTAKRLVEPLPQLCILDRLLLGRAPAIAPPSVDPLSDAVP